MGNINQNNLSFLVMRKVNDYFSADDSILLNDDKSLHAIRLSLPTPPKLELIDGYGELPENQYFKRIEIPYKLKALEDRVIRELKEKDRSNKAFVITNYKIQSLFWETLEIERRYYLAEIEFIKKCWWHRLYGYWFFNNGKPTYIDGWHWMYLNFWTMSDLATGYPDYRDADRKEFLFFRYLYTTTETFAELDKEGYAVTNRYGQYEMKDIGRRVFYGAIEPKNRRAGDTSKGLHIGNEIVSRTMGTDGFGIMSYTSDNAEKHFVFKLVPAWNDLPIFFKPFTSSSSNPSSIVYNVPNNEFSETGLRTEITYATTSDSGFYNGKKLVAALLDEEGSTVTTNVSDRWRIIQNCLSQGNGRLIHGWAFHPSTVFEYSSGGQAYKAMADQSDFYRRNENGQTYSGLAILFIPAYERLDGFIDKFGMPVIENPVKPIMGNHGGMIAEGAYSYLINRRRPLLKDGSPESLAAYRSEQKQWPIEYADCWLGESGDMGFPVVRIDQRIAELDRLKQLKQFATATYNFSWEGGKRDTRVIPLSDPEGRWEISMLLNGEEANAKTQVYWVDPTNGIGKMVWRPMFPDRFTCGADPYDFATKSQARVREKRSRQSDGGIAIFWHRDSRIDAGEVMSEWKSYQFVCDYLCWQPNISDYYEDVLMTCVYYGAMLYPERNKTGLWEYFIKRGYSNYLKYDVDPLSGRFSEKPGFYTLTGSKDELLRGLKDYLDFRVHAEKHRRILEQCKRMSGPEQLKDYDLVTAAGGALLGVKSSYSKSMEEIHGETIDLARLGIMLRR